MIARGETDPLAYGPDIEMSAPPPVIDGEDFAVAGYGGALEAVAASGAVGGAPSSDGER